MSIEIRGQHPKETENLFNYFFFFLRLHVSFYVESSWEHVRWNSTTWHWFFVNFHERTVHKHRINSIHSPQGSDFPWKLACGMFQTENEVRLYFIVDCMWIIIPTVNLHIYSTMKMNASMDEMQSQIVTEGRLKYGKTRLHICGDKCFLFSGIFMAQAL